MYSTQFSLKMSITIKIHSIRFVRVKRHEYVVVVKCINPPWCLNVTLLHKFLSYKKR